MEDQKVLFTKAEYDASEKLAVASTSVEDRHGEKVFADGWDLKNFKKNPVLMWAHDHTQPAIGLAKNIRIDGEGKKARLLFEPIFHELTDMARAIKAMFDGGILNSFSVGFQPIEVDGTNYLQQELLEISAVNVPANPEARMLAYKSLQEKGFDAEVIKGLVGELPEAKEDLAELQEQIKDLSNKYDEVVKGLKHLNPDKGRKDALTTRQMLLKVIARANDKMLEQKVMPQKKRVSTNLVIKRAVERLLQDNKDAIKNG